MISDERERRLPIFPWAPGRTPATGTKAYAQYTNLYTAFGQSLMMWAMLESMVELTARMMFDKFGGEAIARQLWPPPSSELSAFPIDLSKQLTLITKTASSNADARPWLDHLKSACKGVRSKNDFRKTLVHVKMVKHRHFLETGRVTFGRSKTNEKEYSVDDIAGFFVGVRALANEFSRLVQTIASEMSAKENAAVSRRDQSPASTSDR